jgi:hypothetical protein
VARFRDWPLGSGGCRLGRRPDRASTTVLGV